MKAQYSLEQIREFWKAQALEHGESFAASWSDYYAIELEIRTLLGYLEDGDHVLDIGCANGYSTLHFASQRSISITGLDYIPEMIEQARISLARMKDKLRGDVDFDVGDVCDLTELEEQSFDKVICIRVIINLSEWNYQLKGIQECARVLKPGGLLLLSEATVQGWEQLNRFRAEWNLPSIPMPGFNQYLDQDQVIEAMADTLELVELVNFSSTYFVGTRILKPLLIQALESAESIDAAAPDMNWNRWFSRLPAAGDYGTQKLFVLRKR